MSRAGPSAPNRVPAGAIAGRWRPVSRLAERVVGRLLFRSAAVGADSIAELRREAAMLADDSVTASDLWNEQRRRLRHLLLHDDPRRFLRWPPVRTTMVARSHDTAAHELAELRSRPDWRTRWRAAVHEIALGRPRPLPRYPWTSASAVRNAYHAHRFEEATGRSLGGLSCIVEFGGGYGRLCRLIHDLGFSGTYVIVDLPEVVTLQRFYLRHTGLAVADAVSPAWSAAGVVTVTDPTDLERVLRVRRPGEAAFVAIGSLSESPLEVRARVLSQVAALDAFLLFYSTWEGSIDNTAYFASWRAPLTAHDWREIPVPHLAKNAWYLFGRRR